MYLINLSTIIRIKLYFTLVRGFSDFSKSIIKSRDMDCQGLLNTFRDCR